MGNIDSVPVVSQVKSLVQVIGGDEEGARKTQENFSRTGIVASQVHSLVLSAQVIRASYHTNLTKVCYVRVKMIKQRNFSGSSWMICKCLLRMLQLLDMLFLLVMLLQEM